MSGFRGHGSAGMYGVDLQTSPRIGDPGGVPAQSYILGLPSAKLPLRPMASSMPGVPTGAGVPGQPVGYQAGNPGVTTWDVRQRARNASWGTFGPNAWTDTGNAKRPGDPYGGDPQGKIAPLMPFQENWDRGGWSGSNDKLATHDRHAYFKVGYENSGRGSGLTDPPMDGPPRPILAFLNRSITWQQGTVYSGPTPDSPVNAVNGNADDLSRDYQKTSDGRWQGEQGSGWQPVNGGVPGLWQPYGSYAGYTSGPVTGIQSPVPQGAPGDGPRKVFSGPPHGLHSPTLPDYALTVGYYMAQPAMRAPRQDRPNNSTASGQSYSQTVQPQGQTGTIIASLAGGRPTDNVWDKFRYTSSTGWRGHAGGPSWI